MKGGRNKKNDGKGKRRKNEMGFFFFSHEVKLSIFYLYI